MFNAKRWENHPNLSDVASKMEGSQANIFNHENRTCWTCRSALTLGIHTPISVP